MTIQSKPLILAVTCLILLGLGLSAGSIGPVFPTMMAIITASFPRSPGQAASVAAALGSTGGMLLPPLQGVLLEQVSTRAAAGFTALLALLMLGMFWLAASASTPAPPPVSGGGES